MKTLILTLMSLVSAAAFAVPAPTRITANKAVIHLCAKGMMGCAPRIDIDGTSYLLVLTNKQVQKQFEAINGAYQFHHMLKTAPGQAVGVRALEDGHFPNPMAKFDVFKAESLKYNLPK